MSAPQPEDIGFMAKMVVAGGSLLTLFGTWFGLHKYTHGKIDRKADKDAFDKLSERVEDHTISRDAFDQHSQSDERQLGAINGEMAVQRGHIAKLFDKIEELGDKTEVRFTVTEAKATDRHIELLNAIHGLKK